MRQVAGATVTSEVSTTTVGQQLMDLKKALAADALTKEEYEKERKKALERGTRARRVPSSCSAFPIVETRRGAPAGAPRYFWQSSPLAILPDRPALTAVGY